MIMETFACCDLDTICFYFVIKTLMLVIGDFRRAVEEEPFGFILNYKPRLLSTNVRYPVCSLHSKMGLYYGCNALVV
jgi:hypothetical protein